MKIIFDFDDVLFKNSEKFKDYLFDCIERAGISRGVALEEYKKVRNTYVPFSLKSFIGYLVRQKNLGLDHIQDLYSDIMDEKIKDFLNTELIEIAKHAGRSNCYLVTNGDEEFQKAKVVVTEVESLFTEIFYVPKSKKEAIEKICRDNNTDKLIFIEDREKFIEDLDMSQCPNLTIILFDEQGLQKVKAALA